jgi:hypothetical protein
MATRSAKPNGFRVIDSAIVPVQEFLDPLPVTDLPGVGSSTRKKLEAAGLSLCRHVRTSSIDTLKSVLGPALGLKLHRICCGVVQSSAEFEYLNVSESGRDKDSIGVQMSWGVRLVSIPHVHIFFRCLAAELCSRASKAKVCGGALTLKLWIRSEGAAEAAKHMGHGVCYQVSKSGHMPPARGEVTVGDVMPIIIACFEKCSAAIPRLTAEDIRGVGITMSRLQAVKHASEPQHQTCPQLLLAQTTLSSDAPAAAFVSAIKSPPKKVLASKLPPTADSPFASSRASPTTRDRPLPLDVTTSVAVNTAPAKKRQWCQPAISSSQLDHNVLLALPAELRQQVQDEAKQVSALKKRNREFNSRSGFDVPVHGRGCHAQEAASCVVPEAPSLRCYVAESNTGYAGLEQVLQMKHSIAAWMAIAPPSADDVKLVGAIIRSLTTARHFDTLRCFLQSLARCALGVAGCDLQRSWVEWVGRAIEFAQKKVLAEHGAVLCLS